MTTKYLNKKGQTSVSRHSAFWNSVRATPVIIPVAGVIMMLLSPSVMAGGFTLGAVATTPINALFKMFFKWLHLQINGNLTGTTFLGQGPRPTGAKGSGCFLEFPLKSPTSWGMPSGHSQLAWYVVGFLVGYLLIWRPHAFTTVHKIIAIMFIVLAALVVSFSRVWVEGVHTPAQVIIGGLLGFIIGLITVSLTRHFAKIYFNEQFTGETIDMMATNEKAAEAAKDAIKKSEEAKLAVLAAKNGNTKNTTSGKIETTKNTTPETTKNTITEKTETTTVGNPKTTKTQNK